MIGLPTQRNRRTGCIVGFAGIAVLAFHPPAAGQTFGDHLPGLTAEQVKLFQDGKVDFEEVEEEDEGLGPTFNARGCAVCHVGPATGGTSAQNNEVRAGRVVNGTFVDLPGGSLFQIDAISRKCREKVPLEANVITLRQTTPLFGVGLIEAIPDATIRAHADPNDANHDGISGKAASVIDVASGQPRVGRFGWKAQVATLLTFSGDAYLNEMGITNDLFRFENAPNGDMARLQQCDAVADVEDHVDPVTGLRGIDLFTNFMRFLAPPPRGTLTADVKKGEAIFGLIGCASCHTPVMMTGPNPIPALNGVPVALYSDLLLHDVGTGDGIPQADAAPNEIRTAPLWGLRASAPFLHDGSAGTIEKAILRHAGEAGRVSATYRALPRFAQDLLVTFLNSL